MPDPLPTKTTNIGLGQRRLRLYAGVAGLLAALVLAVALLALGAPRLWRLALLLPLGVGVGALVEVRAKTCVVLGLTGQCSLSPRLSLAEAIRGQKVSDPALAATLRRRAVLLALQTTLGTLALTALIYALPL
ncbi:MAG: hypothetical protein IT317_12705 [Anaerolineales bacterium]|nr:hypothetical protein [Anaerolineales bacterium]